MRLDKWIPLRAACDPFTMSGQLSTFTSGHVDKSVQDYDIYAVDGAVYVVRQKHIAVFLSHGTAYIHGERGEQQADTLRRRFPRPGEDVLKPDKK